MHSDASAYRIEPNVWIPMRDGVHLAGRMYVPLGPGPFPAVVSMMPYHKDGSYGIGYLDAVHRYLAERGYVTISVDLRGVGVSEGHAHDAFGESERYDGYDLVEWVARQPWSSGAVGMWGLSYSGITALSTAGLNPPHLKAIVAIHAATDLFDDYLAAHGCRTAFSPDVHWGIRMAASNLLPPLYDDDGTWDARWRERLEHYRPWIAAWHGEASAAEARRGRTTDPRSITTPAFIVGGWRDIFADVAVRVYDELRGPKRLLMGPWKHIFPDLAANEPIGFMPDLLRWWDRWLKDEPNGIESEPPVLQYMYGAAEWRHEQGWNPPRAETVRYHMTADGALATDASPSSNEVITYDYTPLVGIDTIAMHWLPGPDTPLYPGTDDAVSLCFDTASLSAPLEITGTPVVRLRVAATNAEPPLVCRLFQIGPDGRREFITMGWMKGRGATPGTSENQIPSDTPVEVELKLRPISWRVPAGSRLHLTVSCADLSRIWPEAEPFSLTLYPSCMELPVVHGADPDLPEPRIAPPELRVPARSMTRDARLRLIRDLVEPVVSFEAVTGQTMHLGGGAVLDSDLYGLLTVDGQQPSRSTLHAESVFTLRRASGVVRAAARMVETNEHIQVTVSVRMDDTEIFSRSWTVRVDH
mgnify:CR=1 FL=1